MNIFSSIVRRGPNKDGYIFGIWKCLWTYKDMRIVETYWVSCLGPGVCDITVEAIIFCFIK